MAKFASVVALGLLFCVFFNVAADASNEFTVGDDQGWREPDGNDTSLYTRWAAKIRFQIDDSVRFQYKNDSVMVVDKKDFYHCNTSNPIAVFNDGSTVVKLDRSGPFYFISGDLSHCKKGQRLIVNVLTPHSQPPSSPSFPPPQPSPWPASPAPSPQSNLAVSQSISALSLAAAVGWWVLCGLPFLMQ